MPPRKPGLTRRQHVELGAHLQDLRDDLSAITRLVTDAYGKTSKATRRTRRLGDILDALRCELDGLSAGEMAGDLWSPRIYYGADRERRAEWLAANPIDETEAGIEL